MVRNLFIALGLVAVASCSQRVNVSPPLANGDNVSPFNVRAAASYEVLHFFEQKNDPLDGSHPSGLVSSGDFYGTAAYAGGNECGAVFKMNSSGKESVLSSFSGCGGGADRTDGSNPMASLIVSNGMLYGTTSRGGAISHPDCGVDTYGCGTIFQVTKAGKESVLYSFKGTDGAAPQAALSVVNGAFYGTTTYGGANLYGTVFAVTAAGKENTLYSFKGGTDGAYPLSNVIDVNGALYGTTWYGGTGPCRNAKGDVIGCGTVFELSLSGVEQTIYSFQGGPTDGAHPLSGLADLNGKLYGTTSDGGDSNNGTVYELSTNGKERIVYRFQGAPADGRTPMGGLAAVNGKLYGTTLYGGSGRCRDRGHLTECGTVFEVKMSGTERVLHNFLGGKTDGDKPSATLLAFNGALYGTTYYGGSMETGTAFRLVP